MTNCLASCHRADSWFEFPMTPASFLAMRLASSPRGSIQGVEASKGGGAAVPRRLQRAPPKGWIAVVECRFGLGGGIMRSWLSPTALVQASR